MTYKLPTLFDPYLSVRVLSTAANYCANSGTELGPHMPAGIQGTKLSITHALLTAAL